jgi:hypothetical protein
MGNGLYDAKHWRDRATEMRKLADRAEDADMVIMRSGRAVVTLKPASRRAKALSPEAIKRLSHRRVGKRTPHTNAVAAVRDEWAR